MGGLFLGKWWHWFVIAIVCGLLWLAGRERLHVTDFNTFLTLVLVGACVLVTGLLATHRPGEQVTRDSLKRDDER